MTIESLKELEKLIRTCQKLGVEHIKLDSLELKLLPTPQPQKRVRQQGFIPGGVSAETQIETDMLSPDELLFYSATGQLNSSET